MKTSLATRRTIPELVAIYDDSCRQIRAAYASLEQATHRLNEAFTMEGWGSIHVRDHGRITSHTDGDVDDALLAIRHDVWATIIERIEIKRFLSVRRAEEIDRQIRERRMPEITAEAIGEMMGSFTSQFAELLAEAVEEVFNWLRPRHSELKTNSELEVPRKVILGYMVERSWNGWRVRYGRSQHELTALENVFSALDGQGQVTKSYRSAVENAIAAEGFAGVGQTPYFRFKTFGNGNLHLEFLRADLLARFNQIAGGRRLRPAAEAAE